MVAKSSNHTPAAFQMNTGFTMNGFPCIGAWVSYGLGTENQDLPAFVVLPESRLAGGRLHQLDLRLSARQNQGVAFRTAGDPIPDLFPVQGCPDRRCKAGADLLAHEQGLPRRQPRRQRSVARACAPHELAARMQMSIPESLNLAKETEATKKLYGMDSP